MLLLLDAGEMHGYRLHQELVARGIQLQPTVLYRRLGKFHRDGLVASRWSEPVAGPRRHVYELTAEGRSVLREAAEVVAAMRDTYSVFLDAHAHAVARRRDDAGDVAEEDLPATVAANAPETTTGAPRAPASTLLPVRPHKELLVGWLLLHLDASATYGYDLRREFEAHQLTPDPSAIYRMLLRLEADKWVQSRWMKPVAGPRRRFYRLTERGRRNLDEIAHLLEAIRDLHDRYLDEHTGHGDGATDSSN
ncbi:MAG TPA: PadR family transcriptional regulator [Solirubrobacteraceae bacterium]|nr:PadR family transcriptional regulator [Solirubrobacteraceae bacterium]